MSSDEEKAKKKEQHDKEKSDKKDKPQDLGGKKPGEPADK